MQDQVKLELLAPLITSSVLIVISIYNLILFLVSKKELYGYYALFAFAFASHISQYVFIYYESNIEGLSIITAASTGLTFTLFATSFININLHKRKPWFTINRIIILICSLAILLEAINLLLSINSRDLTHISSLFAAFGVLFSVIANPIAGISLWKKEVLAKSFVITFLPAFLGAIIYTITWLTKTYFLDFDSSFILYLFFSLIILQVTIFSIVIGLHWNRLESKQIELQKKLNESLEKEVSEKTKSLNEAIQKISLQNEELSALGLMKDKLLSVVTHDLNNALANLYGMLTILRSDKMTEKEKDQAMEAFKSQLDRTKGAMQQLLNWSSTQMGGLQPMKSVFSLNELIHETEQDLNQSATKKSIVIQNQLEKEVFIEADREMIRSSFRNLLSNAIKFSHEGDSIEVSLDSDENEVLLKVSDNGLGMNENWADSKNLTSTPGTKGESGNGVGLFITKEFVELNGGKIMTKSQPNKGTMFTISLPAVSSNPK